MSTIKVDTYLTRGGASEIAIDKLKGVSSASSISVVAEGGTNTTNLQQGLIKAWWTYDQASTTLEDSYNIASLTDNGTGNHTGTYTVAMAATTYAVTAVTESNGIIHVYSDGAKVAASLRMQTGDGLGSGGVLDYDECSVMIAGDLA